MMTLTKEDLAAIEGLFTGKFQGMEDHFGKIDKRLDGIDERLDGIDERLDGIDDRLDTLESTVSGINLRLEHVESDVESLKIGQLQLSERLNEVSVKVDATYELALENWGQIEESKVRLTLLES